ncbi:MAG TPA: GNAT family N-acetyltransferase [Candidatus Marinimicrobia bacterium]|nr:GNAT family N-acetyltransferase [Candidatus Neomarinimicrobiota bacterium]
MNPTIRDYHPSDLPFIYDVCLKTGDSGKDASKLYQDPYLIGHYYAAPYAVLEPDLCFIACVDQKPVGYILGTENTEQFAIRCEKEWFPVLRQRYRIPAEDDESLDARIIRLFHQGILVKPEFLEYPAHLHIDLLPAAQGQGFGRTLIQTFANALRQKDIPAFHLEVGKRNPGAIAFYQKVGFKQIAEFPWSIGFGMKL